MHKHQCPECRCVWQHERPALGAPDECHTRFNDVAHDCPKCGTEETFKYHGPKPAEFTNHHLQEASQS